MVERKRNVELAWQFVACKGALQLPAATERGFTLCPFMRPVPAPSLPRPSPYPALLVAPR